MDVNEAIKHAINGEAILFLGAGFSSGGKNILGHTMKVGKELSHAICDDLHIELSDNLAISASRYIYDDSCKKGLPAFIDFLKRELECIETSQDQDIILSLPWKRIYTTNYDNIIELASEKMGRARSVITITNARYAAGRNLEEAIIHINGYVKRLNEKTFYEEFKIADENYNKDGLLQSSWRQLFENDLEREKAIIFVGYSLQYDQELVRCIANLNIRRKCIFIDISTISGDNEYKINLYGSLFKFGVEGFAEAISDIRDNYKPVRRAIKIEGFIKKDTSMYYCDEKFSSIDVVDLLVKGDFRECFVTQNGYCIHRKDKIDEVKCALEEKNVIILQSKLGNGKSVFLECLAFYLLEEYEVYYVKNLDTYLEDIQLIQSVPNVKNLLLIDDYGYYIDLLKELGKDYPENLKIVMTCRTAINVNLYYDLLDKYNYNEGTIAIVDLDTMTANDVNDLVKMFDNNRLWGEYDTLTSSQKKKLIIKNYGGNISKIFYLLMKSEPIKKQIGLIMETLDSKLELREFVLAQAINSLCRLKLGYSDICRFVHISDSLLRSYAMNPQVRELIDIDDQRFILASSIFSQYLVREANMKVQMIDMLRRLYIECSDNDEWQKKYIMQRKLLISRSNIKLVFSFNRKLSSAEEKEVFSYYDSIKNLPTATDNPFFWLQFGITALNMEQYSVAMIHFENAYANADKISDFDTYQIDTHYARLLLCNEMYTNKNVKENAIDNFRKAHELLFNNKNRGVKLSYVLRQVGLYLEYYKCYKSLMTETEADDFLQLAYNMTSKFQVYFELKELDKVPVEVEHSYLAYRKLFIGTPYVLALKKCDDMFNKKVTNKQLMIKI